MRQSQKMEAIGRLAGGIAHDFNNLLTVIIGRAEMLLRDPSISPEGRRNTVQICETGERAARLIRQLLQFSRQQIVDPRTLDLNLLVAETNSMLKQIIGENITLDMHFNHKLGKVRADPGQLQQVVMNLVLNSRDALPNGGRIEIETDSVYLDEEYCKRVGGLTPGRFVLLTVADSGIGMDEKTRARIFEPFFTTKEIGKGTGLGLATVFGIIKQMGGDITVSSEVGLGTTFRIYIPEIVPGEQPASESQQASSVGGSETILVVEEDFLIADLLRQILEDKGYRVLKAHSHRDALRLNTEYKNEINLLISEALLSSIDGPDLALQLARTRPDLKVIFISAQADNPALPPHFLGRPTRVLEKPLYPDDFTRRVREVLDGRPPGPPL